MPVILAYGHNRPYSRHQGELSEELQYDLAWRKANEFIDVGKPTRALDTLYDVIKRRKHRSWAFSEKVVEPLMMKYLELCVELRKPQIAKEGLYQYRMMCQSVNVGLLEKVIRSYIRMAEEKTETAKALIEKKNAEEAASRKPISIVEVDDLDNLYMADMTLLSVITEEEAQERSARAALIPWVKFLWESYTQCLDLLRNNSRLENLYHDIAQMAFKFCLAYSRKTEFRKLCERLRKHFDDIINRQFSQMNSIDFSSPETQQLNMETRLAQLDSAITLELWQEAYKAIEDIHLLMNQSKKSQTRMMAYYYQKLSLVFGKAGNLLFHAATLMKYYLLCKDMKKNVSADELQKNASQVVMATLAIPFPILHPEFERFVETDKGMLEKSQKLATLLFLPQPPTRASMVRDVSRHGILTNAIKPLQDLYELLETQFNPLSLCEDVDAVLKTAREGDHPTEYMEQYIASLREVTVVRLIKQVSQVYQTIDYDHLLRMTNVSNQSELEQILVDAVRYNDMQITIDHRSNCIKFGSSLAEASREDLPEGPHLQSMPSETVRLQLVNVMNCLQEAVDMISPIRLSSDEDVLRSKILAQVRATAVQMHRAVLSRQKMIADRRDQLERSANDKDFEEKLRAEQVVKQQMIMERQRLDHERGERERKKVEMEQREMKERRLNERIKQIGQTAMGLKIIEKIQGDDSSTLDLETVLQRQQEELQKEAKEHLAKMKSQEKRFDHIERAKRIEGMAAVEEHLALKKKQEKVEWKAHEGDRISHLIEERRIAVANRDRMKRMRDDKDKFLKDLLDARRDKFLEKLDDFEKSFQEEKARRLAERKEQRKQERRRKYEEEKAAAERARLDSIRKAKEEEERIERERVESELAERNRITLEKQLAKQREIEERARERDDRQRKEAATTASPAPQSEVWRSKSAIEKATGGETVPATASAPAVAPPANVWVPKAIREKKAAMASGDTPLTDNVPPWERPDRERQERERERDREPEFDRAQMRERRKLEERDERPFERKMDRAGPDSDREKRGGDRGDWGRGDRDRDRGFERPKERGDRGFERGGERGGRDRGDRDRGDRGDRPQRSRPSEGMRAPDDGSSWRRAEGRDWERAGGRGPPGRDDFRRDGRDRDHGAGAEDAGNDWRRVSKKENSGPKE